MEVLVGIHDMEPDTIIFEECYSMRQGFFANKLINLVL